jgi:hypothetical protein
VEVPYTMQIRCTLMHLGTSGNRISGLLLAGFSGLHPGCIIDFKVHEGAPGGAKQVPKGASWTQRITINAFVTRRYGNV